MADNIDVTYPDDYAAFEAQIQGGKEPETKTAEVETPAADPEKDTTKSEPESGTEEETEQEGEKGEKGKGLQKRFDKLTQKIRGLESELARTRTAQQPQPEVATPKSTPGAADGEPQAANYDTYEQYVKDLARYTYKQERETQERETQQKTAVDTWTERVAAVRATKPDFDELLDAADDIIFPQAVTSALMDSERGADIAYYLASNREEAERIAKMNPYAAVRALGAIEARLENPVPKIKPKVSGAPEPISPVSRPSASRATRMDDPDVDFGTFERAANARFR